MQGIGGGEPLRFRQDPSGIGDDVLNQVVQRLGILLGGQGACQFLGCVVQAQHGEQVFLAGGVFHVGTQFRAHFRGGRPAGRRQGAAKLGGNPAAFVGIVRHAQGHQGAAHVGEADACGAVLVGALRDFFNREAAAFHIQVRADHGQAGGVGQGVRIKNGLAVLSLDQEAVGVEGGKVAARIVQEDVFRAGIGRSDGADGFDGIPQVDHVVIVHAGFPVVPDGLGHGFQKFLGAECLFDVGRIRDPARVGIAVIGERLPEIPLQGNGMVRVLVGKRFPVQQGVHVRVKTVPGGQGKGKNDAGGGLFRRSAGNQLGLRNLLELHVHVVFAQDNLGDVFLAVLRIDEFENIRMVAEHQDHACGAARLASGFDGAGHAVPAAVEGDGAGGPALAADGLLGGPEGGQVDAHAGTGRENTAFRRQVVQNILHAVSHFRQETGGTLGIFIRGLDREGFQIVLGPLGMVGLVAVACIAFPQVRASPAPLLPVADVEPDGGIGRPYLLYQHGLDFLIENFRVFQCGEVTFFPSPYGIGIGNAVVNIAEAVFIFQGAGFAAEKVFVRRDFDGVVIPVGGSFQTQTLVNGLAGFPIHNADVAARPVHFIIGVDFIV